MLRRRVGMVVRPGSSDTNGVTTKLAVGAVLFLVPEPDIAL
jgi:hypothetical protein